MILNIIDELLINLQETALLFQFAMNLMQMVSVFIVLVYVFGVFIFSYRIIKHAKIGQEKRWLIQLWYLSSVLFVSWILIILSAIPFDYDFTSVMKGVIILATFLIHWTAYTGIFKFRLANDRKEIKTLLNKLKPNHTTNHSITEITTHKASNEQKVETFTKENTYFQKLEDLCIHKHIYKDSTLDRDKVAVMLGISNGYVSQLVNTVTGGNFSTYINRYRVQAVKDIILNAEFDNYSLLAIGLECGFSSKSTFHTAFKKITGMTPNAYRKKHQ
ncbi:helix-turn-helix domain-containing protein [Aquimarina sp. 2201CG1-2-11]|uniref:helix-turn-helix domain-containing protein n=1 Tax=Aquimarina discodermiae TaxID=3231043 RepID=UPI003462533A